MVVFPQGRGDVVVDLEPDDRAGCVAAHPVTLHGFELDDRLERDRTLLFDGMRWYRRHLC